MLLSWKYNDHSVTGNLLICYVMLILMKFRWQSWNPINNPAWGSYVGSLGYILPVIFYDNEKKRLKYVYI